MYEQAKVAIEQDIMVKDFKMLALPDGEESKLEELHG